MRRGIEVDVDPGDALWQHARVDDLFSRKKRRSPLLLIGSVAFALLAAASLFEVARDAPLVFAGRAVEPLAERVGYRIGAALFCLLMAALLFPRGARERDHLL